MAVDFAAEEAAVLKRWREIDAFRTQVRLSEGNKPYTFYDGPPFATGLPHYGHLLASTIKDIIPRYWSMKGFYVERRFGWDTHGLPIEYEIDKKFNISGPAAVQQMGISKYNAECRAIVMRFASEWRETIDRLGRWIDFDNDYKTMNTSFMESVWWVFKQLHDKGLVYRSYRVMPYSTALNTPLSQHEAQQNYKDVQDPAVVVSFPLEEDPTTSLLAWTTTPWTLPSNLALAVNPNFEYIKFLDKESGNQYIMVESLLGTLYKDPKKAKVQIVEKIKGSDLKGKRYKPLFDYFADEWKEHGFKILCGDYVTKEDGTGVVHQAPAFGEEDYKVAMDSGVITHSRLPPNPVDASGKFTSEITDFQGMHVKEADKHIIKHLKASGRLVKDGQLTHSYPFCWRSDTPLIYKAISGWFVNITGNEKNESIIPLMLDNIAKSHWVPEAVKDRRFGDWIKNARDWNISRNRYWGTPIPLWVSDDFSEVVAVGSIEELKTLAGYEGEIDDIHRDRVDDITIPSKKTPGTVLRRVEEVFDCWFESGSMPYASSHYPFENKDYFDKTFPGDFIAEGLDQTRGWFYTLTLLGTHLKQVLPFKNCVVNGIVLAEDGKKMSKRLKNYPDPLEVINKYGADALRLYMINSPVVRGETLRFKEAGVKETVSKVLLPLWNSYKFFEAQVELLKKIEGTDYQFDPKAEATNTNVMDKWILASVQSLLKYIDEEMAAYRLYTMLRYQTDSGDWKGILVLLDDTTNWYIRFNRKRLKGELGVNDTLHALNTLFDVLLTLVRCLAPFTPFIADLIYSKLLPFIPKSLHTQDMRSVHFHAFPTIRQELFDEVVERRVARMQKVIELARQSRERRTIGLKTPLKTLVVIHPDQEYLDDVKSLEGYITEELNVRDLVLSADEEKYNVQYSVSADFKVLGQKLKKDMQKVKAALPNLSSKECKAYLRDGRVTVAGRELGSGDLIVKRFLKEDEANKAQETNSDSAVITILDTAIYPELAQEGLAREIINRVQQLRKKAGLKPTDDVKMEFHVKSDPDKVGLEEVFESQGKYIEKALRRPLDKHVATVDGGEIPVNGVKEDVIVEEEQEKLKLTVYIDEATAANIKRSAPWITTQAASAWHEEVSIVGRDSVHQLQRFGVKHGARLILLRRTLRTNPRVAALVRRLHVPDPIIPWFLPGPDEVPNPEYEEYVNILASLVMSCPNLESFTGFYGFYNHAFDRLTHALSTRSCLAAHIWIIAENAEISKRAQNRLPPGLLSPAQHREFLSYHASWSRLKTLLLCSPGSAGVLEEHILLETVHSLPSLRNLGLSSFDADDVNDGTLIALPSTLKALRLEENRGITDAGLARWAASFVPSRLERVSLIHQAITSILFYTLYRAASAGHGAENSDGAADDSNSSASFDSLFDSSINSAYC
ncbi:hypothetical protein DV737_g5335, partial [Chaetothyriales sp. CBS 132003]